MPRSSKSGPVVKIPSSFECLGMTVTVEVGGLENSNSHGTYNHDEKRIAIAPNKNKQIESATFWHEYVHCVLSALGYDKLNRNEKFVERLAQCLYQLERTRK